MKPPLQSLSRAQALGLTLFFALAWTGLFFLVLGSFELPLALVSLGLAGCGLALFQSLIRQPVDPEERHHDA